MLTHRRDKGEPCFRMAKMIFWQKNKTQNWKAFGARTILQFQNKKKNSGNSEFLTMDNLVIYNCSTCFTFEKNNIFV